MQTREQWPRESLIKLLVNYRKATSERAYDAKAITSVGEHGWRDSRMTHTRQIVFDLFVLMIVYDENAC